MTKGNLPITILPQHLNFPLNYSVHHSLCNPCCPLTPPPQLPQGLKSQSRIKMNIVRCPPVTMVLIRRPDLRYQLGFSVQNGIVSDQIQRKRCSAAMVRRLKCCMDGVMVVQMTWPGIIFFVINFLFYFISTEKYRQAENIHLYLYKCLFTYIYK